MAKAHHERKSNKLWRRYTQLVGMRMASHAQAISSGAARSLPRRNGVAMRGRRVMKSAAPGNMA